MTGIEGRLRFFGFAGVLVVFSISERPGLFIFPSFLTDCNFHLGQSKVFPMNVFYMKQSSNILEI